ncbi:MAG: GNAT family acetyltransferase [Parcubacteria group bacterium GW2011_GWA2_31_28]|nr:MAG: GNAT family acetyltransferase [Parcubacteria group bacterium GW2011_GWA2_31_28]
MNIKIREIKNKDTIKVSNIIKQGWLSIVSEEYPKKAVENQIKENSSKQIIEKSKKVHYYVAISRSRIVGIGGYNEEKVQTFFVNTANHREGVGSKIMERVLKEAKREGLKFLNCWSTYSAVKFYKSFGFIKRRRIKVNNNDNPIYFILMTKKL